MRVSLWKEHVHRQSISEYGGGWVEAIWKIGHLIKLDKSKP